MSWHYWHELTCSQILLNFKRFHFQQTCYTVTLINLYCCERHFKLLKLYKGYISNIHSRWPDHREKFYQFVQQKKTIAYCIKNKRRTMGKFKISGFTQHYIDSTLNNEKWSNFEATPWPNTKYSWKSLLCILRLVNYLSHCIHYFK